MSDGTQSFAAVPDIDSTSDRDDAMLEAMTQELFCEEAHSLETICDRDGGVTANATAWLPVGMAAVYGVAQQGLSLPPVDVVPLIFVGVSGIAGNMGVSMVAESTEGRIRMLAGARERKRRTGESLEVAASRALRHNQMRVFGKYAGLTLATALAAQAVCSGVRAGVQALSPKPAVETLDR